MSRPDHNPTKENTIHMKHAIRNLRRSRRNRKTWLDSFTIDLTWFDVMHDLEPDWFPTDAIALDERQGTTP